ncbi:MAG: DUF188 domain-containing protein [Candidatus Goldbacteria bacterium]|nr:DUF188 domain-containing protein [Candidatus Goldiibacteriota bacterium]
MRVIIDGDSFPWKDEIIDFLKNYNIKVIVVLSVAHYSDYLNPYAEILYVDNRPQETDIKIMNLAKDYDIVLTADVGLSCFLISRNVYVINPRGKIINAKSADAKLKIIHIKKKLRRSKSKLRMKGQKKYSKTDLLNLKNSLKRLILQKGVVI